MKNNIPRAAITGIGRYMPPRVLTNRDLERIVETDDTWIVQRTGIRERHIAGATESTYTMALAASQEALTMAKLAPEKLDLILCGTVTPEYIFPSTASLVQNALGAKRAGAFDMEAACAGFIYGLSIAKAYILSGMAQNVLLICSETLTRVTDWEDRTTCVLFGDGAGAVVIQADYSDDAYCVEDVLLMSDGSKAGCLNIPAGGSRNPPQSRLCKGVCTT